MIHIQNPDMFKYSQAYSRPIQTFSVNCGIFKTPCNSCTFKNPAIFKILAYLEPNIYSKLCQGVFWCIQNAV